MRRRAFIAALGGAAAWPLAAGAQIVRTKPARIGVLQWGRETAASLDRIEVLRLELRDFGYVEGRDIELDIRFAQETSERAAAIATEFTRKKVDVIIAAATPSVHAAKAATQDIPIVMSNVADPLATGLVKSLSRPGGNITGVTFIGPDVAPKRRRLVGIPGIGPVVATALLAAADDGRQFGSGRDLAAWIGLVPRQYVRPVANRGSAGSIGELTTICVGRSCTEHEPS